MKKKIKKRKGKKEAVKAAPKKLKRKITQMNSQNGKTTLNLIILLKSEKNQKSP
jgi:hypothetical protein